jgi:hypothetical protein
MVKSKSMTILCIRLSPTSLSCFCGSFLSLCGGHGDQAAFPADLTAFAPHRGHVSRKACWYRRAGQSRRGGFRSLRGRSIYDPLGELVGVSRSFSPADGHRGIIAHNSNLVAAAPWADIG